MTKKEASKQVAGPRKHVLLLIGDAAGWLRESLQPLKKCNFDLAATRGVEGAIRYIESAPHLALVAVDSGLPQDQLAELVRHVRKLSLRVPIVCAIDASAEPPSKVDLVVRRGEPLEKVCAQIGDVLRASYYPPALVKSFSEATVAAFAESFATTVTIDETFLKSTRMVSGDMAALLVISGESIEGYLLVSGPEPTMRSIRKRLLPSASHSREDVIDMIGELGNRILGAFKARLAQHELDFLTSPPMTFEGKELSLHASIAGPSILLTLKSDVGPIGVELCLRTFDPTTLGRSVPVPSLPAGEVIFL